MANEVAERWPLRNDQIVLMILAGSPAREVAAAYGLSERQVSSIFTDPRAADIKRLARERLQEKILETIEDELDVTSKLAVQVIKRTLEADIAPVHKAKANQDRVAIKVLQGRGFLRSEDRGAGAGFQVTNDQFDKLLTALGKADEAKNIDPFARPTIIEAELIDSSELTDEEKEDVA